MTDRATPLVSIVLPTYNGHRYIADSIASCLRQTYSNFELIIVDGGSTDGTLEVVSQFRDPRLKLLHQPDNVGRLPGALNFGFGQAAGEYLTWTQDDDCFAEGAIAVMVAGLESQPLAGLVYAGYWWIDEQGTVTRAFDCGPPEALYWTNPVGHCFMYRRSVAKQVGEYDIEYYMAEDLQYWLRLFRRAPIVQLPGHYFYHRWQSQSLTVRGYGRYLALRVAAQARRQVLGISWWTYQRQLAAAYIEEAFAARQAGDQDRVRSCVWRGVLRNPGWWLNRGVRSLAFGSLVGGRPFRQSNQQS
jgi:glycosyltransferase involved in cell wall biosynthesis